MPQSGHSDKPDRVDLDGDISRCILPRDLPLFAVDRGFRAFVVLEFEPLEDVMFLVTDSIINGRRGTCCGTLVSICWSTLSVEDNLDCISCVRVIILCGDEIDCDRGWCPGDRLRSRCPFDLDDGDFFDFECGAVRPSESEASEWALTSISGSKYGLFRIDCSSSGLIDGATSSSISMLTLGECMSIGWSSSCSTLDALECDSDSDFAVCDLRESHCDFASFTLFECNWRDTELSVKPRQQMLPILRRAPFENDAISCRFQTWYCWVVTWCTTHVAEMYL